VRASRGELLAKTRPAADDLNTPNGYQPEPNTMKDVIRVVLVDPQEESRSSMQRMLVGVTTIWLSEVLTSYQEAATRAKEIAGYLTIVSLDHDTVSAVDLIQKLIQSNPSTVVIAASKTYDSELILKVIRAGAREFLTLPAEQTEVLDMIARLLRGRSESLSTTSQAPRIITVTGAAGGVGSTTVAVNLAGTLAAAAGQETILLDLDLFFGAVDACLDIIPDHTLAHVMQNFERLDITLLKRSIPRHASGLYVLPHPVTLQEAATIDPDTLRRLFGMLRASFDTVVIDTSKGLQSSDFTAFEMSDVILVVIQLEMLCLRNTARLIGLLREFEGLAERVKLIANRSRGTGPEISQKKAEETLKMPISWEIPNAFRIFQDARIKGVPLGDAARSSRPHQAFLEIARALRPTSSDEETKPKRGLFAAFF
jgi:pilus assembly protein CpaE